jgi:hypothetical protein
MSSIDWKRPAIAGTDSWRNIKKSKKKELAKE